MQRDVKICPRLHKRGQVTPYPLKSQSRTLLLPLHSFLSLIYPPRFPEDQAKLLLSFMDTSGDFSKVSHQISTEIRVKWSSLYQSYTLSTTQYQRTNRDDLLYR